MASRSCSPSMLILFDEAAIPRLHDCARGGGGASAMGCQAVGGSWVGGRGGAGSGGARVLGAPWARCCRASEAARTSSSSCAARRPSASTESASRRGLCLAESAKGMMRWRAEPSRSLGLTKREMESPEEC